MELIWQQKRKKKTENNGKNLGRRTRENHAGNQNEKNKDKKTKQDRQQTRAKEEACGEERVVDWEEALIDADYQ